jgi:hypothetical protein
MENEENYIKDKQNIFIGKWDFLFFTHNLFNNL